MKKFSLSRVSPLAGAALLLGGCYSVVSEKHTFIASNRAENNLSLVQVTVKGYADGADMKFRAGYRDSSSVDEVLKGDTTPITTKGYEPDDKDVNEAAAGISGKLLDKLENAYAGNANPEKLKEIEDQLTRARALPRVLRTAGTSLIPEAPAEKFLIAFSADPSKVFKAVADTTARNESEGAIFKSLRDFAKDEEQRRLAGRQETEVIWNALLAPVKGRLPAPVPDPNGVVDGDPAAEQRLRAELTRYQTLLNDFLASQP